MKALERLAAGFLGIVLRSLDVLVPKDPDSWVFGALDGMRFVDNPKYLFLHSLAHAAAGERMAWITRSERVLESLQAQGLPCFHNYSPAGIWRVLRAGTLVVSTKRSDVLFFYRRPGRTIINLHHGMPIKRIGRDYDGGTRRPADQRLLDLLWTFFVVGFRWQDVDVVASTSAYYRDVLAQAFGTSRVSIVGQPRTDVLIDTGAHPLGRSKDAIRRDLGLTAPFIATYMPTHRRFGTGAQSPIPFAGNRDILRRLRDAGIQLAIKLHPEALRGHGWPGDDLGVLTDVSVLCEDPQDLLQVSDCLITDYSSCFIDYLLVDRPIIFYLYDEEAYVAADNGVYYRMEARQTGPIVRDEASLLDALLSIRRGEDTFREKRQELMPFFHEHRDARSCARTLSLVRELVAPARSD